MSGCATPTTGRCRKANVSRLALGVLLTATFPSVAASQTEYYNLDSNRPFRVEDAVPTERRSLDVQLAPVRLDAFVAGARRWRVEPKLSYGIASLTEIELRVPVLFVQPGATGAPATLGLTSIGIGGMRAINTETSLFPAVAISAEVLVPAGSLAPPKASYAFKGLLTKTMSLARLSINGSYGTYSVVPAAPVSAACHLLPPGSPGCTGRPSVPDVPCSAAPTGSAAAERPGDSRDLMRGSAALSSSCLTAGQSFVPTEPRAFGNRWFAGATVDHTFALSSTLVGADLFAERLIGLYALVDWTAEIGVRRQWSPHVVFDAGISRHFAGTAPSTAITVGATYSVAAGRR